MSAANSNATIVETTPDALALATRELEPEEATVLRADIADFLGRVTVLRERARGICVTARGQEAEERAARVTRLALRALRVEGIKRCKDLKASSLRRGRALDGVAAVIREMIEPIEEALELHEKFTERADAADRSQLQAARAETLHALGANPATFADLGVMSAESWTATLDGARLAHEARIDASKHEAAIRVEAERIAAEKRETERQERIKVEAARVERERVQAEENARLRAEAAEREAQAKADREAAQIAAQEAEFAAKAERDRVESERKAEREAVEAKAREQAAVITAERAAEKAKADAAVKAAQEETDRAARALAKAQAEAAQAKAEADAATAERVAADAAVKAAEEAARQASLLAPDREKLAAFAATLRALAIPSLTTAQGQAAAKKVASQLEKMAAWVASTGEAL